MDVIFSTVGEDFVIGKGSEGFYLIVKNDTRSNKVTIRSFLKSRIVYTLKAAINPHIGYSPGFVVYDGECWSFSGEFHTRKDGEIDLFATFTAHQNGQPVHVSYNLILSSEEADKIQGIFKEYWRV